MSEQRRAGSERTEGGEGGEGGQGESHEQGGGSHEQGGGSWEGRRGRDRGTRGVGAGSAAAAAAPAARRLAHSLARSLAEPAARRPALGCPQLRLPARRSGAARGSGGQDRATGRPSPGRPPKQVGGVAGTARTRSLDARRAQGDGGGGLRSRGGGFADAATNFPPVPRFSAVLLGEGSGSRVWRGEEENAGAWENAGESRQDAGLPAWVGAGPLAAVGTQRPRRGRPERSGAAVRGGRPLAPRSLGTPTPEPPRAAPGALTARRASGALPAGVAARSLRGAARFPAGASGAPLRLSAKPRPEPCALLLFGGAKRNACSFLFFLTRSPRFSSGKSGTRTALWVDFPDVPPALRGDPSSRS